MDIRQVKGIPRELGGTVSLPLHEEAVLVACADQNKSVGALSRENWLLRGSHARTRSQTTSADTADDILLASCFGLSAPEAGEVGGSSICEF